jgi:tripartite-type tricarboxylate transporter receptor subunit TctC
MSQQQSYFSCSLSSGALAAAAFIVLAFGPLPEARAQSTATIIVGYGAGGGFDGAARMVGRHIGKYLPNHPSIIVQNMPGAGGLKLANYLEAVAPKDGSVIGIFSQQLVLDQLLGVSKLDFRKFGWIGSLTNEQKTCIMATASPAASWQGMLDRAHILGGQGRGSDQDTMTNLLHALFGTKSKLVTGYNGTKQLMLALERGEIEGWCGQAYGSFTRLYGAQLKSGKVRFVVYASPKDNPHLSSIPNAFRLAKTDEQRQILNFMMGPTVFTRPFLGPPGLSTAKRDVWRRAFEATVKDPGFLADANRAHYEIEAMTGAEVDAAIADIYATPKTAVTKAKQYAGGR